jgi:predicted TIM-barrel fold metal-dependent hydrolase
MNPPILDTHLHLVYKDRFSYPWLGGAAAINRQWTAESYFAEAETLGIEGALHMEVDVAESDIEAETRFMTKVHPKVVGAIAAGRPESPDFARLLDVLAAINGVKGMRRVLHTVPNELSQTPLFAENLRRLAAHHLPFDLCLRADQLLPVGKPLVGKCPDVQFVLDHCGVPDITGAGLDPWRAAITEIARLPNIACKVSGIIAYAGKDPTAATLQPYVEHVIQSFGWDRVVWGSDHPVCTLTANLTKWVGITRQLIAGASEAEQDKLLSQNAKRIYHL